MARIAIAQTQTGIDPAQNVDDLAETIGRAASEGASMLFTPEMTNIVDRDRSRSKGKIVREEEDLVLTRARDLAHKFGIWIALGSLAIDRGDGRMANRSFVLDLAGQIAARYDKMHMFDVALSTGETWQESAAYAAGDAVVALETPIGKLGLAICYDIRFPALFDALGSLACDVIAIPAAFTRPTGQAHWHVLQRARAIEASAYVVAAAQSGRHEDGRETFGHSLVIDPWGEILLDLGEEGPVLGFADIDISRITDVRRQLPSLANRREIAK